MSCVLDDYWFNPGTNIFHILTLYLCFLFLYLSISADLWSFSLAAARTTNFSMESHPHHRVPAASSPLLLPSLSPRPPRPTAVASCPSTFLSSRGAKPWTWRPSALLPMATHACTPCHLSVKPHWTSTSSMCPAWQAKSLTMERPKLKARRMSQSSTSKVRHGLPSSLSWLLIEVQLLFDFNNTNGFFFSVDLSVREECDEDPSQCDETEAEMSPPKSPSTPKNVKSKNSGMVSVFLSPCRSWLIEFKWFCVWVHLCSEAF